MNTEHGCAFGVHHAPFEVCHWRIGIVVRVFALQSVDLGFISHVELYQKTKKWYSQLPCLAFNTKGILLENKPASLLVSLGKTLNGML